MSASPFRRRLAELQPGQQGRRWLFVPYDQLSDALGPLREEPAAELGIVLVESPHKAALRPYHKQKLALVLTNLRHFALEQAARGVAVRHVVSEGDYCAALTPLVEDLGPLRCMEPAERELRVDLAPLVASGGLRYLPHEGWLSRPEDFETSQKGGAPYRMDAFYRQIRRQTGILMQAGKPEGGRFSFDGENRKRWPGKPPAPEPPRFEVDEITAEVCALVESRFADHPGSLTPESLPASAADARTLWDWAKESCLQSFGPFQDAMAQSSASLFHTRISALLHLHRLLPADVVAETLELDLPLASREGFIRQVLGWREFVRHVHAATDGFREGCTVREPPDAGTELPPVFWGERSGLHCLDRVVQQVWQEGYGHHITRLMVLSNLAVLLDLSPRALTEWFWVAYTDAYDWVVEPNVLGMGSFAVGDLMTTKPYIAGSAYIDRMSDLCGWCDFDPKQDCPIRALYWAWLGRHAEELADNRRMGIPLNNLKKRSAAQQAEDQRIFRILRRRLQEGERVAPEILAEDCP